MDDLLRIGLLVGAAVLGIAPARAQSAADAGRDVYAEHCATCHGERLSATGAAPDLKLLRADQKTHFDEDRPQRQGPDARVGRHDLRRGDQPGLGLRPVARREVVRAPASMNE
jgi:mono/diheme cytochrome c family protein